MIDSMFKRVIAYLIDMMLVSIVVSSFYNSPIINVQLEDYTKNYDEYLELFELYNEQHNNEIKTCDDFEVAFSGKKLTEEKYVSSYEELKELFEKKEIDEEEYDSKCLAIIDEYNSNKMTEDVYLEKANDYVFLINKYSTIEYIINIVVCLLYFVFFQKYTGGQTLGKKIMHLKVVSIDGSELNYKKMFIRTLFLYNILSYFALTIVAFIFSKENFINVYNTLYLLNYVISLVLIFTITFNKGRRGIHDMISHTKVIEVDSEGNEVKRERFIDRIFNSNNNK